MKYNKVLNRRTFLRGSSVSLCLPFLESMRVESVYGAEPEPNLMFLSLMHGLGSPPYVVDRGYEGPLRYYRELVEQNKLSMFPDIDMRACADNPVDAQHHSGQPYLFSGYKTKFLGGNNVDPQGPSMHFAMMKHHYPAGPPTPFRVMDTGIYFRRGINYQYQRIFDEQGRNAADFEDLASPITLFEKLFGSNQSLDNAKSRAELSIIDYLIPAYKQYTTGRKQLPASDVVTLNNHLERLRQLEVNVYGPKREQLQVSRPNAPDLDYTVDGGSCGNPSSVYRVDPIDFETAYQHSAELFAIAVSADYFRFGNLSLDSGGGHTHLTGAYATPDDPNYVFNGNPHARYHRYNPNRAPDPAIVSHQWLVHKNLGQALRKLDDQNFPMENGKTALENAIVMIGSEVGANHDCTRVLHGVAGGAGRLNMGMYVNERVRAIELYNAIGHTFGLDSVGDGRDYRSDASVIVS